VIDVVVGFLFCILYWDFSIASYNSDPSSGDLNDSTSKSNAAQRWSKFSSLCERWDKFLHTFVTQFFFFTIESETPSKNNQKTHQVTEKLFTRLEARRGSLHFLLEIFLPPRIDFPLQTIV